MNGQSDHTSSLISVPNDIVQFESIESDGAELDYDEDNRDGEEKSSRPQSREKIAEIFESCYEHVLSEKCKSKVVDCDVDANSLNDVKEVSEDGEIDDLEEGELKSDDENNAKDYDFPSPSKQCIGDISRAYINRREDEKKCFGICKFFLRGTCTWGPECKFTHINEPRSDTTSVVQSSSSENSVHRPTPGCPLIKNEPSSGIITKRKTLLPLEPYSSSSTSNETVCTSLRGGIIETAWEKGLRQARALMVKASRKREEPDFDRKRLVLTPNEELDKPRTTDDDSDDSRYNRRHRKFSPPSIMRNLLHDSVGRVTYDRLEAKPFRSGRFDEPEEKLRARDYGSADYRPFQNRSIPSLIDGMIEKNVVAPKRSRGTPASRFPPRKDLGPQVLYPNGRPSNRRTEPLKRAVRRKSMSPDAKHVPYRKISRHDSCSPLHRSSYSVSKSPRGNHFSHRRCRSNSQEDMNRAEANTKGADRLGVGDQIRDPWDRCRTRKEQCKGKEMESLTLGAELKKARKRTLDRKIWGKNSTYSNHSRGSASITSSTSSRSGSIVSSKHRRLAGFSFLSSAASKNVLDDGGSPKAVDLSSFRIPKKKRMSPLKTSRSSRSPSGEKKARGIASSIHSSSTSSKRKGISNSFARSSTVQNSNNNARMGSRSKILPVEGEDISSDESSSTSSSFIRSDNTSDDGEPAAYRLKRKAAGHNGHIVSEGPISPDVAVEDVSSDEEEKLETSVESSSRGDRDFPNAFRRQIHKKSASDTQELDINRQIMIGDSSYVDNETEKEERRTELLRQLKCVEEAIARKRSRPVV